MRVMHQVPSQCQNILLSQFQNILMSQQCPMNLDCDVSGYAVEEQVLSLRLGLHRLSRVEEGPAARITSGPLPGAQRSPVRPSAPPPPVRGSEDHHHHQHHHHL